MIRLTREQTAEAVRHPDGVECQGDGTDKTFILMDTDVVRQLRHALYRKDVHAAISAGIADLEAGRMMTAQEADDYVRSECGLPARPES
ncbi:MAG: hypothetical protein RIK87_24795 [Fuerstiella sp.]